MRFGPYCSPSLTKFAKFRCGGKIKFRFEVINPRLLRQDRKLIILTEIKRFLGFSQVLGKCSNWRMFSQF